MPVLDGEILNWDDNELITNNYRIKYLSPATLADIFRVRPRYGNPPFWLYVPLTELSIALEYQLVGERGWLYHLTNVLLHAANSVLVAALISRLFGGRATAVLTGVLFAVHPLHVESVAWISERKDVLCAFFYLLTLLAHVSWQEDRRWWRYVAVQAFGVLALLAKPSAITLPAVLLLCDVYKGRVELHGPERNAANAPGARRESGRPIGVALLVIEKLPLGLAALAIALITVYLQRTHGALEPGNVSKVTLNLLTACHGVCLYVVKTLLPVGLSPIYPEPAKITVWDAATLAAISVTLVVIGAALLGWRRTRRIACALSVFLVTLLPNAQLVPTGLQIYAADRFYYLPGIGLLYLVARAVCAGLGLRRWRPLVLVGVAAYVGWLAFRTFDYARVWQSDWSLWTYARTCLPGNPLVDAHLADCAESAGRGTQAITVYQNILSARFDTIALTKLAVAYYKLGNATSAYEYAMKALHAKPDMHEALFVRAAALYQLGDVTNAVRDLARVIQLVPLHPEAHHRLARALLRLGNTNEAIKAFQTYLRLRPDDGAVAMDLGHILVNQGAVAEASAVFHRTAQRTRNHIAWHRYGLLSLQLGKPREALRAFQRTTRIRREYADGWMGLAIAHRALGQHDEALIASAYATQLAPGSAIIWYDRSCILATAGMTNEALAALERAVLLDETMRVAAATDPDFAGLRDDARFRALLSTSGSR